MRLTTATESLSMVVSGSLGMRLYGQSEHGNETLYSQQGPGNEAADLYLAQSIHTHHIFSREHPTYYSHNYAVCKLS